MGERTGRIRGSRQFLLHGVRRMAVPREVNGGVRWYSRGEDVTNYVYGEKVTRPYQPRVKDYNQPNKNDVRAKIAAFFKEDSRFIKGDIEKSQDADRPWRIPVCLTLESPQYLFVDSLTDFNHVLYEHNPSQYEQLIANKGDRKNILDIFPTDIGASRYDKYQYDYAFMDLCGVWRLAELSLIDCLPKLLACRRVAIEYFASDRAPPGGARAEASHEETRNRIVRNIIPLFPGFEPVVWDTYRDGAPMAWIILQRRGCRPSWKERAKPVMDFYWDFAARHNDTVMTNRNLVRELYGAMPYELKVEIIPLLREVLDKEMGIV